MRVFFGLFFTVIGLFGGVHLSSAAEFSAVTRPHCNYLMQGEIVAGDAIKFQSIDIKGGDGLCLESPGGNFMEGLEIAERLTGANIETVVDKDAKCFSACALIFMAGSEFEEIYISKRRMDITAKLGFHAPYITPPEGSYTPQYVQAAYFAGLQAVARMMKLGEDRGEVGFIPVRVMLKLLETGPDKLYYVDDILKVNELRIQLDNAPKVIWSPQNICHACIVRNEGRAAVDACDAPVAINKIDKKTTEYVFFGFAGEGSFMCAVRLSPATNIALIQSTLSEGAFPLHISGFSQLQDQDGLPIKPED